jgi:biopolymer transport protein ExbB/TolQ
LSSSILSPLGLFLQAGPVGKTVMVLLFCASIWCWALIAESLLSAWRLARALRGTHADMAPAALIGPILSSGEEALALVIPTESHGDRRQRIAETMTRAARKLLLQAESGLPSLAVISSVAPFIGLFGTVWGIMTSFAGIAESADTSLAVVAPGIAQALAATAYGLAAAIPASFGYNRIGAAFAGLSAELDSLVQERTDALLSRPRIPPRTEAA